MKKLLLILICLFTSINVFAEKEIKPSFLQFAYCFEIKNNDFKNLEKMSIEDINKSCKKIVSSIYTDLTLIEELNELPQISNNSFNVLYSNINKNIIFGTTSYKGDITYVKYEGVVRIFLSKWVYDKK